MTDTVDVAVVGGGITGLTAAYTIASRRPDLTLRLFESRGELGGNIRTERIQEHLVDAGPDSFLRTKPQATELCRELGLEGEFLTTRPDARTAYLVHRGALTRLPAGMVLAVPTRLGPMWKTPVLSWRAKLRVLADVLLPRRAAGGGDESVASFLTRRFGAEAARTIGAPLLGGIYAGDTATLSVRSTFPQLAELEDRFGSVIYGMFATQRARFNAESAASAAGSSRLARAREVMQWMRRESDHAPSPFLSLRGGLGTLIAALAARLPPAALRTAEAVVSVERRGDGWLLRTAHGEVAARAVLVCAPAHVAARVLPSGALTGLLGEIPYVSTATVFFAVSERALRAPLDGVGFIVPPGEGALLASTWVSSKWEHRAPPGSVLLRAFVGGTRAPAVLQQSDGALVDLARAELERLMGPLGEAAFTRVYRYADSNPQPVVGHRERLERLRADLRALPGLELAGAAYDGVGIPDCVRQARAAAESVLGQLAQSAVA